jgi:hypothetical protein
MKSLRLAGTLYAGTLLFLLLFPPWTEGRNSFLGHHWRFAQPEHKTYQWSYCLDSNGVGFSCNPKETQISNNRASVDYALLEYDAVLGLVGSAFIAFAIGPFLYRVASRLKKRTPQSQVI